MRGILRHLAAVLALAIVPFPTGKAPEDISFHGGHLTCVIDLGGYRSGVMKYSTGFNYEILQRFARDHHCGMEVILAADTLDDYLAVDTIDFIVRPFAGEDNVRPLADSTCWVASSPPVQRALNRWLTLFSFGLEYPSVVERFTPSYEPFARAASGRPYANAGPYDALVKKYAATLDWDWRLLEAVVWQESKFRIEARSPRGAVGLMQMMPTTATRYGVEDMLDPEDNLRAGTEYLGRLSRIFAPYAEGGELDKFTLAAYNAGEGRILDCIRFAQAIGKPCSTWDDLEAVIPLMREVSAEDSVLRLGYFKGYETISYIHLTDSLYRAFCTIAP